ncbi:EAL domain-containing protein [Trinickia terrae]|uniref:EAL domain-containing protein n=1 Tax=Trinickia terrae TaxID=2571161 RepID=UPI001F0E07C9|nr:EAL domain-containing protein [Trinickia terrae]
MRRARAGSRLDQTLYFFSIYVVPVLIAASTIVVLLLLPREYESAGSGTLPFRALDDKTSALTPAAALEALKKAPTVSHFSTRLSETPIWFTLNAPVASTRVSTLIEFPSRHAQTLECWTAPALQPLGQASRYGVSGQMRTVKAGFAVSLRIPAAPTPMLCRGTFSGPAQLTVQAWDAGQLRNSALDFQESSGLIAGGLLTLAVFVFVTAMINREWTYVIFAMWLVGNLRLCANAMGWDAEWLDRVIPPADLPLLRKVTFAAYYLLTGALFSQLFRRELRVVGCRWLLRVAQNVGLVLLALSIPLSYAHFIPALWVLGGFGIGVLIFLLARLLWKARSRTVMWYAASLAVVLLATFSEVLGAAFGVRQLAAGVSPVLAALTSSMMAAFAIAEQMRAEREHRRQAQIELRNTYEVTPIGLFTLDSRGRFVRANPALRAMLGMQKSDYGLRHWNDYFEPGAWGSLQALSLKGRESEIEIGGSEARGTAERRYLLKAISSNDWIEGSLQDVTERSKAIERLRFLAEHDPLTGSLNRRGLEKAIVAQSENAALWALAYIDLDRFKLINDLFGHRAGDEVLKQVADRVLARFHGNFSFGRMGGDEFVCVMNDTPIDEAAGICTRLLAELNETPYQVGSRAFQVKASIGLVECSHGVRVQDALSHADRACREAKESRQHGLVVYRKGAAAFEQRAAELRLVESFGRNRLPTGLFLVMQPIMSLTSPTESLNFEVLLRMRGADGKVVSPDKIIAAAEESGNIAALDMWVVSTTLDWIETNLASLPKTRFICVNLNGGSLNDERFTEEVFALFMQYRPILRYLCLEITESVALHDLGNTQRFINRVHDLGAKIALDDFGAGYTSFRYLKSLSADALKIDGEFVRSMCSHPADVAIVEALVALAHNLGMRSVAEWVEDLDTLKALHEIGVDYVQGYVVARPQDCSAILTADSAASFIADPAVASFIESLPEPRETIGAES